MKTVNKLSLTVIFTSIFTFIILSQFSVFAGISPALNTADTFWVLSSTYTNTIAWTTINGDIWYTTPPAMTPIFSGTLHVVDSIYSQAGINQASALADLNSQGCTFNFAPWAIDLSTDTTHGPIGVYGSWVYCINWAASIWAWWITLDGTWTYIFRITWALTTVANSSINVMNGASSCDIFWTPTDATTFWANTEFRWNIIDNAGITMWANSTLLWRALAFGWTITTDQNTITTPTCIVPPAPATLHIIKNVVDGTGIPSDFNLYIKFASGSSVVWSPSVWVGSPWTSYSLDAGIYVISEDINSAYTQSFSWDCSSSGNIILSPGDDKTCTIINTYIQPIIPIISSSWWSGWWLSVDSCPDWDDSYSYYDWVCWAPTIVVSTWAVINTESTWSTIIETIVPIIPPSVSLPLIPDTIDDNTIKNIVTKTPWFPNAGIYSENNTIKNIIIIMWFIIIITSLVLIYERQKK